MTVQYTVHAGQVSGDRDAMRAAYRGVAAAYRDRPWWSDSLAERLDGALRWDELRSTMAAGDRRAALSQAKALASSPQRLRAVLELLRWRLGVRRAASRVEPDGSASVLLASDAAGAAAWAEATFGVEPTRGRGPLLHDALELTRRPPGRVVTRSRALTALARLNRVEPCTPGRATPPAA